MADLPMSTIELALEHRDRTYYQHDVAGIVGLSGEVHAIDFRAPVKDDEDDAVRAARQYVAERCADDPGAQLDPDIAPDAKLIEILWRCCFQPLSPADKQRLERGEKVHRYPTFTVGPKWMRKHLKSDQLAVLFNLLTGFQRHESVLAQDLDTDRVIALARGAVAAAKTDVPDKMLAQLSRDFLVAAFIVLAELYVAAVEPESTTDGDVHG